MLFSLSKILQPQVTWCNNTISLYHHFLTFMITTTLSLTFNSLDIRGVQKNNKISNHFKSVCVLQYVYQVAFLIFLTWDIEATRLKCVMIYCDKKVPYWTLSARSCVCTTQWPVSRGLMQQTGRWHYGGIREYQGKVSCLCLITRSLIPAKFYS